MQASSPEYPEYSHKVTDLAASFVEQIEKLISMWIIDRCHIKPFSEKVVDILRYSPLHKDESFILHLQRLYDDNSEESFLRFVIKISHLCFIKYNRESDSDKLFNNIIALSPDEVRGFLMCVFSNMRLFSVVDDETWVIYDTFFVTKTSHIIYECLGHQYALNGCGPLNTTVTFLDEEWREEVVNYPEIYRGLLRDFEQRMDNFLSQDPNNVDGFIQNWESFFALYGEIVAFSMEIKNQIGISPFDGKWLYRMRWFHYFDFSDFDETIMKYISYYKLWSWEEEKWISHKERFFPSKAEYGLIELLPNDVIEWFFELTCLKFPILEGDYEKYFTANMLLRKKMIACFAKVYGICKDKAVIPSWNTFIQLWETILNWNKRSLLESYLPGKGRNMEDDYWDLLKEIRELKCEDTEI